MFTLWTNNDPKKHELIKLISDTFGEYFDTLPITLLTEKRPESGSGSAELADKHKKRIILIKGTRKDIIYSGLMKELTGCDWLTTYTSDGVVMYKPQFKMIYVCDELPVVLSDDHGTWRRFRVVAWESSTFDTNTTIDFDIKQAFMWLLLNVYYPQYYNHGLNTPIKIIQYTNNYKETNKIEINKNNQNKILKF